MYESRSFIRALHLVARRQYDNTRGQLEYLARVIYFLLHRNMAALGILLLLVLPGLSSGAVLCCDFDTATEGSTELPCLCSGRSCILDRVTERFSWTAHQGRTPTARNTGPNDDHTRGDGSGLYIYTEVSQVPRGSVAEIRTPELSLSVTSCLTFWYHMKGLHIGDLEVLATFTDATTSVIWERKGEQGDNWLFANTTLSPSVARVTFRSTKLADSGQPQGDMALDDIRIEEAACDSDTTPIPCTQTQTTTTTTGPSDLATTFETFTTESTPATKPATPTTPTTPSAPSTTPITTTIPSTEPPTSSNSGTTKDTPITSIHCDFDSATMGSTSLPCECSGRSCVLEQVTTDHLDWTVEQGQTPSGLTGPDDDHTKADGSGFYIYTEITQVPRGSVAEIRTPELSLSVTSCLTFWYHMKGEHIGDLQVLTADTDGITSVILARQGEQGDTWLSANTTLDPRVSRVSFRSIKRAKKSEGFGDIALDDIDIVERPCDPDITEPPIAITSTPGSTTTRAPSTTGTVSSTTVTKTEREPSTAVPTTTWTQTTTHRPLPTSTSTTEESTVLCDQSSNTPWILFGVTLAALVASIIAHVIMYKRNQRPYAAGASRPTQSLYVNADMDSHFDGVKINQETSNPASSPEVNYEPVGADAENSVPSADYVNSPGAEKSPYEDIPANGTQSTVERPSDDLYEQMKKVRPAAPNLYDALT